MTNLVIEKTAQTPYVHFNAAKGQLKLKGAFTVEEPLAFYKPLITWLQEYTSHTTLENTIMTIQLDEMNNRASKCLFDILKQLENLHRHHDDHDVQIHWCYYEEDDDMLSAGEEYESMINLPFVMLELKPEL